MHFMPKTALALGAAVITALLGMSSIRAAEEPIRVRVAEAPRAYILQIGTSFWTVNAGDNAVASHESAEDVVVRLLTVPECRSLMAFTAAPGTNWTLRFAPGESTPKIEQHEDADLGPTLQPDVSGSCRTLPATDVANHRAGEPRPGFGSGFALAIGIATFMTVLAIRRRSSTALRPN